MNVSQIWHAHSHIWLDRSRLLAHGQVKHFHRMVLGEKHRIDLAVDWLISRLCLSVLANHCNEIIAYRCSNIPYEVFTWINQGNRAAHAIHPCTIVGKACCSPVISRVGIYFWTPISAQIHRHFLPFGVTKNRHHSSTTKTPLFLRRTLHSGKNLTFFCVLK